MEEVHRTHKDAAWGWVAVILAVLDGFPRPRTRVRTTQYRSSEAVTLWSHHSPGGGSA